MPLWAKIYWVVAISLFLVWVWRRLQARSTKAAGVKPDSLGPTPTSAVRSPLQPSSAPLVGQGETDLGVQAATREWPAPPPPDPNDDTYRLDPTEAASSTTDASDGSIGDGSPTGGVDRTGSPRATLPELLAGITLPHELVPLTQVDTDIDLTTHVVVATTKASSEMVGDGLAAEFERLGYTVQRNNMTELVASGPRGALRAVIHPDGANVHDAGLRRFPTAEEHMVVVELFAG